MNNRLLIRLLLYAWASPTTLVGLFAGFVTLCSGGRVQRRRGALEFHGGIARPIAEWFGFLAMTLGHVIIGRDPFSLALCRDHEQAHVRQVERWGFAFIPAYLLASLLAWWQGGHYYFDNWFERNTHEPVVNPTDPHDVTRPRRVDLREQDFMHQVAHVESHFTASELVRDIVIGMADGLTVPFALAAGLSGTELATTAMVVTAGLAEIAAGSIAMGLGGYLAAKSDAEHYVSERHREETEILTLPHVEREEVAQVFREYGLAADHIEPILHAFENNHPAWVDFMMRFELGLERPDPRRALRSATTIAGAYIAGGLIPLAPYMVVPRTRAGLSEGLWLSIAVTLLALLVFGYIKGHYTGTRPIRSAIQTTLIGGIAAAAAFLIARIFS